MNYKAPVAFRITPWRPWLFAVALLVALAAVGAAVSAARGELAAASGILLLPAIAAPALLLVIALTIGTTRWHIGPGGVGGRNNWHVYRWLDWSEIESVEPWLIPGYRYLQVNGGGRRWAFWLPLFLTDMPGFRSAVARYAPEGNPLRRYLEENPT